MRFVYSDPNASPSVQGAVSAVIEDDGTVTATAPQDILALIGSGFVPYLPGSYSIAPDGQTNFNHTTNAALFAAVL